jgi:altronate dehydratase
MKLDGLTGYRRGNGTVGIRNHVVVLAAADNVNPLGRQLADQTPGVTFIRASFGRANWATISSSRCVPWRAWRPIQTCPTA